MGFSALRVPKLVHHVASGRARVRIDGKDIYVGKFGTPEAEEAYRRVVAEWIANGRRRTDQGNTLGDPPISVSGLILRYLEHAVVYYRKDGEATSEVHVIKSAMRVLREHYGLTPAAEFGPLKLKAVREALIAKGLSRSSINGAVSRIRRLFRWGTENELVPISVYQAVLTVAGLQKGRSNAKESSPVRPVDEATVNATLPFLPKVVSDMVRLQLLSGCRPGEIVAVRPCDIHREGEVWEYVPASHKTEHHGQSRRIYFGPRAQVILGPYLENRPADAHCFSPEEAETLRRTTERAKTVAFRGRRWRPGKRYSVDSYRRAIARGCKLAAKPVAVRSAGEAKGDTPQAKVPAVAPWHPNQLRHTRATYLRSQFGIEGAQTVLGHANLSTTEIYAETAFSNARRIMAEIG